MNGAERINLDDGLVGWKWGDGDTIVWLHGYTMDSTLWMNIWSYLSKFCHVGIDLPGHGASRPMRSDESLDSVAESVLAACNSLNASRLVGLSLGSLVALQAAITSPKSIQRLVLAAPVLGGMTNEASAQQKNIDLLRTFRAVGPGQELTELWLRSPPDIFKAAERTPAVYEAIRHVVEKHKWHELKDGIMRNWADSRQSENSLTQISARTLILVGDQDMPRFRRNAHILARLIPDSTRSYLPGAGHLPLLEVPALCAPLLEAHLG